METRWLSVARTHLVGRLVAFFLLVASAVGIQGQSIEQAAATDAITPGDSVRLELSTLVRVEGRFIVADATTLALASGGDAVQVAIPDIERLWVRGRHTRKGAWIGASAGALLGVVGGLLISRVACEPVDGGDCTAAEVAAVMGLVGGAGGAALGAGLGSVIPTWRLSFP